MSLTTIYFIRHGEIDNPTKVFYGRSLDLKLTDKGKDQLSKLAQKIKEKGVMVNSIYSSPLKRALQSAQIIGEAFNNPPIFKEQDLIDVDIPALVGHPVVEREQIHAQGTDEYDQEFVKKGNEPRKYIIERMMKIVKRIREENQGKTILIVSHGDPLRFLLFGITHSNQIPPPMGELKRSYYPEKGGGWKMVFNKDGNILETKFIEPEVVIKKEKEK